MEIKNNQVDIFVQQLAVLALDHVIHVLALLWQIVFRSVCVVVTGSALLAE
jgi:hypothetical protein